MDTTFIIKVLISFVVGGLWVVITTVSADRFGTKIGGLIAGLPSTLLFGLLFIGWTQNPVASVQATTLVPIISGINALFLFSYILLTRKGFYFALFVSLVSWLVLSLLMILTKFNNFWILVIIYICIYGVVLYLIENKLKITSSKGKKIQYSKKQIVLRGLLCGVMVSFSVICGKLGGSILGGVSAMFPAMFISTLIISYITQGLEFSLGMAKSSMAGALSIVIFAVVVRYTFVPFGLIVGILLAISTSLLNSYLVYRFIVKKLS